MTADHLPGSLLAQGHAMLEAVVRDFTAVGVEVTVTLDRRLSGFNLSPARVIQVDSPAVMDRQFNALARAAELAMVIAPEVDNRLADWLGRLERLGVPALNSSAAAAAVCSDKLQLAHRFSAAGVPAPDTQRLGSAAALAWPCIVKPRFGAGCEQTYFCQQPHDLTHLSQRSDWIVQPWMPGLSASCSLIIRDGQVHTLPGGFQKIRYNWAMQYAGGRLPLKPHHQQRAAGLAQQAVAAVAGLNGYVGVDLVLGDDPAEDCVIEINPRLTMSYLGLRQILPTNLAAVMLGWADVDASLPHMQAQFTAAGRVCLEQNHQEGSP